jgi:subtilase family serine protease
MSDEALVRVRGWSGRSLCATTPRALPDSPSAHTVAGSCGSVPGLATASPPGYGAQQLRAYLRLHGTGAGQTVAIVDAYDNPYATRDIRIYSKQFGLPLPCPATGSVPGCFRFSVVHPYGFAGADPGWALESDLDVQMVHAIAPQASIVLVEAYDNSTTSLFQAIGYAAALKPSPEVISNSWGAAEFGAETTADGRCDLAGTLCVAAAGDGGNPGLYPAYDPYVLSVGGTTMALSPSGRVQSEAAWCCGAGVGDNNATGGGVSQYEPRPAYQDAVNPYQGRGIPDVSFDADPYTGVAVHDTFGVNGQNGWFEVGGTSVGTPAWAGIVAAADQLRAQLGRPPLAGAGFEAQELIYRMRHARVLADITQGINNLYQCNATLGTPVTACQAHRGYDLVTGWGSPRPGIDAALALGR